MITALAAFFVSACMALVITPWVRAFARRAGAMDEPGGRRIHTRRTPRLGGLAVLFAFLSPFAIFGVVQTTAVNSVILPRIELIYGLILGSLLVGGVGAWDDLKGLGPRGKLIGQAAAAVIAFGFGYRIDAVSLPFWGEIQMGYFALPVTVFWFLGVTNAINLIDGLDGLAVGIALCATVSNGVIALAGDSYIVVLLSAALAGALLGFLRYNFNPATIFLGDSGSLFVGFALAAISLSGATLKSSTTVTILAPIIALGVPIFDTSLAMVRRTLAGQSIFAADRGHVHHRLVDLGITHRRVVLLLYSASIALAAAAVAVSLGRSWQIGLALLVVLAVLIALVRTLRATRAGILDDGEELAELGEVVRCPDNSGEEVVADPEVFWRARETQRL